MIVENLDTGKRYESFTEAMADVGGNYSGFWNARKKAVKSVFFYKGQRWKVTEKSEEGYDRQYRRGGRGAPIAEAIAKEFAHANLRLPVQKAVYKAAEATKTSPFVVALVVKHHHLAKVPPTFPDQVFKKTKKAKGATR